MKEVYIPCKNCISYAMCINRIALSCSILFQELECIEDGLGGDPTNERAHIMIARRNRHKARKYSAFLGHDNFIISRDNIYIFNDMKEVEKMDRETIRAFLHAHQLGY